MTSIKLGKMCIHCLELLLLKCDENVVFFSKATQNKVRGLFCLEKCPFYYVMFSGCLYFLNKTLDQVYSIKLRSCNPTNRKNYIYNTQFDSITLICRNSGLFFSCSYHSLQQNLVIGMYLYVSAISSQKKIALMNLFLITQVDVTILLR